MSETTESGNPGFASPPPPVVPDALRMGADFAVAPAPQQAIPTSQQPPSESPKVYREIDLKDGSGVQRFEAATYEELVDKLATAQENATRKIRELSQRKPVEPEREVKPAFEVKQPSPADMLALKEGFDADPATAIKKAFEMFTGQTPEEYQSERAAYLTDRQRKDAEVKFLASHKDFYNCPENAQKISELLSKENLQVTKRNLEWAYQNLQDDFVKPNQVPVKVEANLPPPPEPKAREIPPPPVTIPARFGERPMESADLGGVNAAEFAEIAKLPPDQMKARIETLFRGARTSAR
jgi:hypothetical protein